nr:hypothetical protein [Micromonospora sp. DSM 115978]
MLNVLWILICDPRRLTPGGVNAVIALACHLAMITSSVVAKDCPASSVTVSPRGSHHRPSGVGAGSTAPGTTFTDATCPVSRFATV